MVEPYEKCVVWIVEMNVAEENVAFGEIVKKNMIGMIGGIEVAAATM